MMRTANPALNDDVFIKARRLSRADGQSMTISGTVNKSAILLVLLFLAAVFSWDRSFQPAGFGVEKIFTPTPLLWVGLIGGLIIALVTIFKRTWSPVTSPVYAIFEGLFLGAVSAGFEAGFPGIVLQAVLGTFGTLFALLMAYRSGLIKATENFKLGVAAATGGIFFIYLISMVLGFFQMNVPFIHESGIIGIGFSLFVVIIAALNLVLDFDFIENGEKMGAPKYMEWYAAFGLLVTLVWLYLEMLRLLAKLRDR